MELSPDQVVYWRWSFVTVNATLVFTWAVMAVLAAGSRLLAGKLRTDVHVGRGQALVEAVVLTIRSQIEDAVPGEADPYLAFVGTLFLFIAASSLLSVIPGFEAPTASLSTAAALATCVFLAVPAFGIRRIGWRAYLRHYLQPSPFMLPFHVIGELSRTLALAVRLFGNVMSGKLIVGILLSIVPFLFPALLEAFGLLIGVIQAYVFAVLALVYIASGTRSQAEESGETRGAEAGPSPAPSGDAHGIR